MRQLEPLAKQGSLVVLSAPAGTGKTTLARRLLSECDQLSQAISCTTRRPRPGEREGIDYFFTTQKRFLAAVEAGEFLEWVRLFGDYYGTLASQVRQLQSARKHVILVLDVRGALELKRRWSCLTVFIAPPSMSALESRLRARNTETPASLSIRLQRAHFELAQSALFDYTIVNDDLEVAYKSLLELLRRRLFSQVDNSATSV